MIRNIPQARFLAVIPFYVHFFVSGTSAYIENAPSRCAPTTYAMITPSPNAEPYAVTEQGQQITTYLPQYAVCNPDYTDCTTAYKSSIYAWCSTRMPCYGHECTVTDCNQMVTFSHSQSYNLNSVVCPTAGNCNVYGTNIYVPSPTIHTYVEPVHTYYAAPYLEYVQHGNPPITVEECVEIQPGNSVCSVHVEMWEEQYIVHTSVEIIPVTVHTYCAEATKLPHGNEMIHVTAPTTLTFLTEVKKTTLSTETWTMKAQWDDSCTASDSSTVTSTSTSTVTEYVTKHNTVPVPTNFVMPCLGEECKHEAQALKPRPMLADAGCKDDCAAYIPQTIVSDQTCTGYGCPIAPPEPECNFHDCAEPGPAPIAVETPCVTSTTYIPLEYPSSTIAPAAQSTTTLTAPVETYHYFSPVLPPASMPVSAPAPAICEGAYCPIPEYQPTPAPNLVPECKGYGCPVLQPEPVTLDSGCSGVTCPEHDYDDEHVPELVAPVEYPCEGYDCLDEYEHSYDNDDDLEGYDFEFEDDDLIHTEMTDMKIDMSGGSIEVTVGVDPKTDTHDIDMDF